MPNAPLSPALREIKQLLCVQSIILYYIKQIDSMLPCICPVIDHRERQNVVRTSVTHSAIALCASFLFLPHFDVICDLLLDRCTATWNLFVKYFKFVKLPKFGPHGGEKMARSERVKGAQSRYFESFWPHTKLPLYGRKLENKINWLIR